jgi:hypothetical protein
VLSATGGSYLEESASGETTGRPLLRDGPHEIGDMSALAHFADSSRTRKLSDIGSTWSALAAPSG